MTATRADTNPRKLDRLKAVYAEAVSELATQLDTGTDAAGRMLAGRLRQLDLDGERLRCLWAETPNAAERACIEIGWHWTDAANSGPVEHLVFLPRAVGDL